MNSADLSSALLSATTRHQISSALSSLLSSLPLPSDQSRPFFSLTFPSLLSRLFGFSSPSSAWLETSDSELSATLFSLLSPHGPLLSSIFSLDRLSLLRFLFPPERLPDWLRFALSSERDSSAISDLCPSFLRARVSDNQVQLNVFEYYMLWFIYYPLSKPNTDTDTSTRSDRKIRKFALENWIIGAGNRRGPDRKGDCAETLYNRLLYAYLRAFVPTSDSGVYYRPVSGSSSSLLHYSNSVADDSVAMKAEFFVSALVHYWLIGNDFSPLPVSVMKSAALSVNFRSVLGGDAPPVSGLGEVVSVFVRYLSLCSATEGASVSGSPRWRKSGLAMESVATGVCGGPWNVWIQRPLYRFLLRNFLFCPVGSSLKNVSGVVSVWIAYVEPWRLSKDDFSELDSGTGSADMMSEKCNGRLKGEEYSSVWEDYVLSNYLYYTSLVMHFIGFAHKFLHTNPELMIQMVAKIINVLTCSKELLDLIKNVDIVFHSRQAGFSKSALHNLYKSVTPIREQLQDWEDGLCENGADGSFLHDNWNNDLQLFSDGEDGGQQLLQLFVLRAESELHAMPADPSSLQSIDLLKSQLCSLFGGHALKQSPSPSEKAPCQQFREEIFMPRRVGNRSLKDIKYKGDWMRRPISDDEVGWLAKLLVHVSVYLNESLGLNQEVIHESPTCSFVDIAGVRSDDESGPKEALKIISSSLISSLLMLRLATVKLMVKHGVKVNLRIFASKKLIMLLLVFLVFSLLKKAFRWLVL